MACVKYYCFNLLSPVKQTSKPKNNNNKNAKQFSPFNAGHSSELSVLQLKDKIAWKTGGVAKINNKILLFDKN